MCEYNIYFLLYLYTLYIHIHSTIIQVVIIPDLLQIVQKFSMLIECKAILQCLHFNTFAYPNNSLDKYLSPRSQTINTTTPSSISWAIWIAAWAAPPLLMPEKTPSIRASSRAR